MKGKTFLFSISAFIAFATCNNGGEGERISAEKYCETESSIMCEYFKRCCTSVEQEIIDGSGFNCENITASQSYQWCVDPLRQSLDGGRLKLSEDTAMIDNYFENRRNIFAECTNHGTHQESTANFVYHYSQDIFLGQVQEGGECYTTVDCLEGLHCHLDNLTVPGTCASIIEMGQACADNTQCGLGNTCIANTCAPISNEGGSCDAVDILSVAIDDCGVGLWCNEGTCQPLSKAGENCSGSLYLVECEGICETTSHTCVDFCNGID